MKTQKRIIFCLSLFVLGFVSCDNDDDLSANISINEGPNGDIGGDFTGNGGSTSRTFTWRNNLSTADYNADITSAMGGIFQMEVKDADGETVLNRSLEGNKEPDSFSGVTSSGTAGDWSVTITVINFAGDGSFTLSAGD